MSCQTTGFGCHIRSIKPKYAFLGSFWWENLRNALRLDQRWRLLAQGLQNVGSDLEELGVPSAVLYGGGGAV